jgi:hypothetical protein
MVKFKALKGIANNLADGFTSATHIDLVNSLVSLSEIDLLNESITQNATKSELFNTIIDMDKKMVLRRDKKGRYQHSRYR